MEINMKKYNLKSFQKKDIYSFEEIVETIEELENEILRLDDEILKIENDIKDNYKRISVAEQSEDEFLFNSFGGYN